MPAQRKPASRRPPAKTPEARENQMIAMAIDVAEKQLHNGTASAQVITHFLKLGTERARIENETQRLQNELIKAKTESIQSQKRVEELYLNALSAMRTYQGTMKDDDDET